ncbi:MAG: D-lactate dehydrogenase [Porticoccaceae bacterium]|nr:D-lactate dehydrogenase [Porticoccaceae bacterium]MDG1473980.1 D-lactate dehydrogenase [Porticoccaceae bacterium]
MTTQAAFLKTLCSIVGWQYVLTGDRRTAPYVKGFREGYGPALAVVKPKNLWQQWQVLEACIKADIIVVMQAANTGLTGGSTPVPGCDRETVVINTTRICGIQVLDQQNQIVALSGASLFDLESKLAKKGRLPHSVIGSSCIGASIVGGVCNNSGGALVERGPAYTELALFAEVDSEGTLSLVNNLDIDLGSTPKQILTNLDRQNYAPQDIKSTAKVASDKDYATWVKDVSSSQPARFNADPRRLYEASGCAGKLAVFAVRLDSFAGNQKEATFFVSSNSADALQKLRVAMLTSDNPLPVSAEYIHQNILSLADRYGRDIVYLIRFFGSGFLPFFFRMKRQIDAVINKLPFLGKAPVDKFVHYFFRLFPSPTPRFMALRNEQYKHHLLITEKDTGIEKTRALLHKFSLQENISAEEISKKQAESAYLMRYACAGAAVQYGLIHDKDVEHVVALDIGLRRNDDNWFETLPLEISQKLIHSLYYGHFLCHVFHQDYVVRKGEDPDQIKDQLLHLLDERGAQYPAEHNVGHHYIASPALSAHYKKIDPRNALNSGIGGTSKNLSYNVEPSNKNNG